MVDFSRTAKAALKGLERVIGPRSGRRHRLFTFIAYAPESYKQNLGRAYNDYMARLGPEDTAVFIDHDAVLSGTYQNATLARLAQKHAGEVALVVARTNRIFCAYQRLTQFSEHHDLALHEAVGDALHGLGANREWDVSHLRSISGHVMMISQRTWSNLPFADGFLGVDKAMHAAVRDAGGRVLLPHDLYAYHFYRADGDASHAVHIDHTQVQFRDRCRPDSASSNNAIDHVLRSFVFSRDENLRIRDYIDLLEPGEWACFLDSNCIHCSKGWYSRLSAIVARQDPMGLVLLSSNRNDAQAPASSDYLRHRQYASDLRAKYDDALVPLRQRDPRTGGFAVSREALVRLARGLGKWRRVADIPMHAARRGLTLDLAPGVYIQNKSKYDQSRSVQEAVLHSIASSRRIAMISAKPHSVRCESALRHLAAEMTREGDHVTVFTPYDRPLTHEPPNFLKCVVGERDLGEAFARHHEAMGFDAILAIGGVAATRSAINIGGAYSIPVALWSHGLQAGADSAKRPLPAEALSGIRTIFATNPDSSQAFCRLAPKAEVQVVGPGVDTLGFTPHGSRFLRDCLPDIEPGNHIIVTAGWKHDISTARSAFMTLQLLIERGYSVSLVQVGRSDPIDELVKSSGLLRSFHQIGQLPFAQMSEVYASSDIFVRWDRHGSSSSCVLEAMAMGVPCVCYDEGPHLQRMEKGATGFRVPVGDVAGMADAISRLLEDLELRQSMGTAGRVRAIEHFGWPERAKIIRSALSDLW